MDPRRSYTMSVEHMGRHAVSATFVDSRASWHSADHHHYRNIGSRLRHYNA